MNILDEQFDELLEVSGSNQAVESRLLKLEEYNNICSAKSELIDRLGATLNDEQKQMLDEIEMYMSREKHMLANASYVQGAKDVTTGFPIMKSLLSE